MVPMSSAITSLLLASVSGGTEMGAVIQGSSIAALGNSTIRLSAAWNAFWFWGVWTVCIMGIGIVLWAALRSKRSATPCSPSSG